MIIWVSTASITQTVLFGYLILCGNPCQLSATPLCSVPGRWAPVDLVTKSVMSDHEIKWDQGIEGCLWLKSPIQSRHAKIYWGVCILKSTNWNNKAFQSIIFPKHAAANTMKWPKSIFKLILFLTSQPLKCRCWPMAKAFKNTAHLKFRILWF